MKQRVRGPNMMRSQNPNPPNDLQEKGHQRAGLPEREVINDCYGLSGYQLAPLKSCPNPGWLGLIVVLFEKIPSVDSSPTTPLLIEKLSVSFSPILSEPICTSLAGSWHLVWELKVDTLSVFCPDFELMKEELGYLGCWRAAAVHMISKTGSRPSLIGVYTARQRWDTRAWQHILHVTANDKGVQYQYQNTWAWKLVLPRAR